MTERLRPQADPISTEEVQRLARYNAERNRGIVHDPQYVREMVGLQRRFDARMVALDDAINRADAWLEVNRRTRLPLWFVLTCGVVASTAGAYCFLDWLGML